MAFSKSKLKVNFAENLGVEIVDVYVGPERKRYVVHKNLLTAESDYFKGALLGSFMEAEENSIYLKEEDPAAVALLIAWLYHGIIPGTENLTNYFGPFITTRFSPSKIEIPVSEMGTVFQFNPTPSYEASRESMNHRNISQHLCSQSHYTIFSPEELRLADYKLNRRYQSDGTAIPTAPVPWNTTASGPPPPQPAASRRLESNNGTSSFAPSTSQSTVHQTTGSGTIPTFNGNGSSVFAQPASQSPAHRTTTLSGGDPLFTPATSLLFTPQAPAFGLFTQPAPRSSASQASSSSQAPSQPNIFALRYGPVTSAPSSNPPGVNPTSQRQSLLSSVGTSTTGGLFSTAATLNRPPRQSGLFGGFGSSLSSANTYSSNGVNNLATGGVSGTAATSNQGPQSWGSIIPGGSGGSASTAHMTSSLFGGSVLQASSVPASTSSHSSAFPASATGTGLSASGFRRPLFGAAPNPVQTAATSDFQVSPLPPGAKMMTITPHKPKPGEFCSYSSIKDAKSPGLFLPGISRADPQSEPYIDVEKQQLALLNLCIMAETFCWPSLFNDAINAYIRGEHRLQRPIPLDFIDRIYTRTHDESTLRGYALNSLCQMNAEGVEDLTPYMELAQKHQDFLADLLGKVMGSSSPLELNEKTLEHYKYGMGREEEML